MSEQTLRKALKDIHQRATDGSPRSKDLFSVIIAKIAEDALRAPLATALDLSALKKETWREWEDGDWDHLWSAIERHLATLQPPSDQVGEELVHLVRFLANYQRELCEIRAKAMKMLHLGDSEGARDLLVLHWPIVQGSQNQWDLETIGKQPFDMAKMRPAIKAMLDGAALLTQPQAPVVEVLSVEERKRLITLVGATILAVQPELREQNGRFELDFAKTVPAIVDALLQSKGGR